MGMQPTGKARKSLVCEINVVPYIDVMLVLLVIFMITTPLLNQGVNVDLPQGKAKPLATETEPLIVSVDTEGHYYLNTAEHPDSPLNPNDLAVRINAELNLAKQQQQNRQVFIKGDKGVEYGKVVEAMLLLQTAGVEHVGLMTQPQPDAS